MERIRSRTTQTGKPSFILTSDIHLREDTPTCWTGNFMDDQTLALGFICGLQSKYKCPVIHAGDLFHHWKPSPWLLSYAIQYLPDQFYTVYGQHDLPQHNWKLREKSGIYCLEQAGRITVLDGVHYGQELKPPLQSILTRENGEKYEVTGFYNSSLLVWHHMTYITPPYPGASGGQAEGILRKYPQFNLIVTGDNHQSFWTEYEGRLLVNPGPITRQDADQIDFKPRVYLYYADTNTVEAVFLPVSKGTITRAHIDIKEQRDARIIAFVSQLNGDWAVEVSFENNLKNFQNVNSIKAPVMEIINKAIA